MKNKVIDLDTFRKEKNKNTIPNLKAPGNLRNIYAEISKRYAERKKREEK